MYKEPEEKLIFKGPKSIEFAAKSYDDNNIPIRCSSRDDLLKFLNNEVQNKLKYNNSKVYATLALNIQDFNSLLEYVREKKIKYTLTNRLHSIIQEKQMETQNKDIVEVVTSQRQVYSSKADNRPITKEEILPFKLVQ